jgi:Protein of unknown function (DUF2865)
MSDHLARRVNPRALLSASASGGKAVDARRGLMRFGAASLAAVVGLSAFGAIVVRANDDAGVLAFVRQQSRQAAPAARAAQPAYPVAYYAPRGFFPTARSQPIQQRTTAAAPLQQQRTGTIVASYAPFSGFFPTVTEPSASTNQNARRSAKPALRETAASRVTLPAPSRSEIATGGRVTYCVRTCDGFFFPIGTGSGSDNADASACNRLCPTAETKIYVGQIGQDIDDARSRDNGRRYAAMGNAFSYRRSIDKSCSCTANGFGVATDFSVYRDGSLRAGDIVMTRSGMKVFNGGSFPYREANFSAIGRSDRITSATRETLRRIEQASLPGRSGLSATPVRGKRDELKDLAAATQAAQGATSVVRYVGPDRGTATR